MDLQLRNSLLEIFISKLECVVLLSLCSCCGGWKVQVVKVILGGKLDAAWRESVHRWSVILYRNCFAKCIMGLQTTHPLRRGGLEKRVNEPEK